MKAVVAALEPSRSAPDLSRRIKWRRETFTIFLLGVTAAVVGFRFWTSFCFFLLPEWNSVRLAPSFMLFGGLTPYPGITGGPLTTWIYGPVPLLINLPATLAHDSVTALYTAGAINLLWACIPVVLVSGAFTGRATNDSRLDRPWIILLSLALWPNTSLQYLQADNVAVCFGLMSNFLVARGGADWRRNLLLAALCAALAVWSKQTSLGLVVAQLAWLTVTSGLRNALRYGITVAAITTALAGTFIVWFGFGPLWLNLVTIPARLPPSPDLIERTLQLGSHIAADVILPAACVILFRRHVWRKDSAWLLPVLSWACLLPTALVSIYKIGGASNSLNGFLYLVVPAAVAFVTLLKRLSAQSALNWVGACIIGVVTQQLAAAPLLPIRPMTTHLHEAAQLARAFPGQIYFPWHPLVTWFSEHRFYHTEDGLYTRQLAKVAPTLERATRHLPDRWAMTAVQGWREGGAFRELEPAAIERGYFGKWTIHRWTRADAVAEPAKAPP